MNAGIKAALAATEAKIETDAEKLIRAIVAEQKKTIVDVRLKVLETRIAGQEAKRQSSFPAPAR